MGGVQVVGKDGLPSRRLTPAARVRRGDQAGDEHDTHVGFGGYSIVTRLHLLSIVTISRSPTSPLRFATPKRSNLSITPSPPLAAGRPAPCMPTTCLCVWRNECQVRWGRGLKSPVGNKGSGKQRNRGGRRRKNCSVAGVGGYRGDANCGLHDHLLTGLPCRRLPPSSPRPCCTAY